MKLTAKNLANIRMDKKFASLLPYLFRDKKGMAALTATKVIDSEFAGDYKLLIKTVTPTTLSDTLTLVRATDKVTEIAGVVGQIETGLTTTFADLQISFSGLVITIASFKADGTTATTWGQIRLFIIGR